jgi:hypothetical protein
MRARLLAVMLLAASGACAQTDVTVVVPTSRHPPPDVIAWDVFAGMMMPAPGGKAVAYETWASDDDIYGSRPHWPDAGSPKLLQKSLGGTASRARKVMVAAPGQCAKPQDPGAGNFPADGCIGEEVRHNRVVYDYLVGNRLNTVKGLVAAYARHQPVVLPYDSVVAKADWVPLADLMKWQPAYKNADQVRHAFYTNTANLNGKAGEFALVGVSIQYKDRQDWLWFTIEHRSNPGRCDIIGCHDSYGALEADVPPAAAANGDYGPCAKTPILKALFALEHLDPVWENYCLKGGQDRYVTNAGAPAILGNSVVERINHGIAIPHVSCVTCHAYASFDKNGHGNFAALKKTPIGAVNPQWLDGYDRADFMWGLLNAK